jgi:hypothetical protein
MFRGHKTDMFEFEFRAPPPTFSTNSEITDLEHNL